MKNESVKKSLEKSKNVLKGKRKNRQAKNLDKKDQHVFNVYVYNLNYGTRCRCAAINIK